MFSPFRQAQAFFPGAVMRRISMVASRLLPTLILGALMMLCSTFASHAAAAATVLIVADEIPAMQVLADRLKAEEAIESKIITQKELPSDLAPFAAVIVYIHKALDEAAEMAFIKYTEAGGKLIALHHTISSGKRKNKEWFKFLGVELPLGDVSQGGYKYYEGITMQLADLNPRHFITTNKFSWSENVPWRDAATSGSAVRLGVTLHETEVYLNHVLVGPRTVLLGLRYTDAKSGKVYAQATAGWIKPAGKGLVIYLMAGHSAEDFKNQAYGRVVLNAVIYRKESYRSEADLKKEQAILEADLKNQQAIFGY